MNTSPHDALADIFGEQPTKPSTVAEPRIAEVKETLRATSSAPASGIKYHADVIQGSDEWLEMRRGILTASEMKLIITPTLKVADNDKTRAHVYEIAAQRITGHVEPSYISDDMLRGMADEVDARLQYIVNYAPVKEVGFVTNDSLGFVIGASPDGIVGEDGGIECKSRRQRFQVQTLVENVPTETIPPEYMIQVQTCLWVTQRKWWDFISYSGGLPMSVTRVLPDPKIQSAIVAAATAFEEQVRAVVEKFHAIQNSSARLVPTERRVEQEITL